MRVSQLTTDLAASQEREAGLKEKQEQSKLLRPLSEDSLLGKTLETLNINIVYFISQSSRLQWGKL